MNVFTKSLILTLLTLRTVIAAPEIIGGTAVQNPDTYNFVANIYKNGKQFCTGTRVAENFIITAGHCMLPDQSAGEIVFANSGTEDTSVLPQNNNEIVYSIANQVAHPGFNVQTMDNNDILLMEIKPKNPSKTVPFNSGAVTLDDGSHSKEGQNALAMGYGIVSTDYDKATQLQQANLVIANLQACQRVWAGSSQVYDTQLCAGTRTKNPCIGDSGGPLFYQDSPGHVFLLGTVSFGTDCGVLDLPSVYTRINPYLDWINSVLKQFPPVTVITTTTSTTTTTTKSTITNPITSITSTSTALLTSSTTTLSSSSRYGSISTSSTSSKSSSTTLSSPAGYAGSSSTSSTYSSNAYPKSSTTSSSIVYHLSSSISSNVYPKPSATSSSGYVQLSSSTSAKSTPNGAYIISTSTTLSVTSGSASTITTTTSFEPYIVVTSTTSSAGGYPILNPTTATVTMTSGGAYIIPSSSIAYPGPTNIPPAPIRSSNYSVPTSDIPAPLPGKCRIVTVKA